MARSLSLRFHDLFGENRERKGRGWISLARGDRRCEGRGVLSFDLQREKKKGEREGGERRARRG